MKLIGHEEDEVDIRVNLEELLLLRNVLNETCNAMNFTERDFVVIFDASRTEAKDLLLRINNALERLHIPLR